MAVQLLPPIEQNKKIIRRFGEWQLYRGFNQLHHLDLGNYLAEYADADGKHFLSICVLRSKGVHRSYGKYGQPSTTEAFSSIDDRWYHWTAPVIADQALNSWTLYDLRKLRFQNVAGIDPDLARGRWLRFACGDSRADTQPTYRTKKKYCTPPCVKG